MARVGASGATWRGGIKAACSSVYARALLWLKCRGPVLGPPPALQGPGELGLPPPAPRLCPMQGPFGHQETPALCPSAPDSASGLGSSRLGPWSKPRSGRPRSFLGRAGSLSLARWLCPHKSSPAVSPGLHLQPQRVGRVQRRRPGHRGQELLALGLLRQWVKGRQGAQEEGVGKVATAARLGSGMCPEHRPRQAQRRAPSQGGRPPGAGGPEAQSRGHGPHVICQAQERAQTSGKAGQATLLCPGAQPLPGTPATGTSGSVLGASLTPTLVPASLCSAPPAGAPLPAHLGGLLPRRSLPTSRSPGPHGQCPGKPVTPLFSPASATATALAWRGPHCAQDKTEAPNKDPPEPPPTAPLSVCCGPTSLPVFGGAKQTCPRALAHTGAPSPGLCSNVTSSEKPA